MRLIRIVLAALLLGLAAQITGLAAPVALAQQAADEAPDYQTWERTATRADEAIEAGRASTSALETLRSDLAGWRQRFLEAQGVNANAIATVQRQLDALGPAPEDGSESTDIAQQREELNARLAELQTPVKRAELAHNRAEGLIAGVDKIIRERQAEALLELGPSPLEPENWGAGLAALYGTAAQVRNEFQTAWGNSVQRADARQKLPAVVVLTLIGLVLVFRGRRWSRRMSNWMLGEQPGAGRWLAGFSLSMGSLILPFLGVVALTEAMFATNLVGIRGEQMIRSALGPVFIFLLTRWVATRIFPSREARTLPLCLNDAERQVGRWNGAMLGLVVAGYFYTRIVGNYSGWSDAATNVVLFPFIVLAGLILLRLARLLRAHCAHSVEQDGEESFRTRITRFLALALSALAVVSPVLAALGYFTLAHYLMFPSLVSLLLLSVLLVLQRLVTELYVLITGNREGAAESLTPVLIGMVLVLLSLPVFALVWGARPAQLADLWTRFNEGISIGDMKISPSIFLTFAIVFAIGYVATRLVQGALRNTILPKTRLDQGGRNAIVSGVGYLGIFLAALIAVTSAGLDLSSIAIVAGALSVGIGFGLRTIVENFVSGIILLIERPISEGDWIEVGGTHGTVRDISVRSTRIETFDRSDVILPNADLVAGRVTNYTRGNTIGRVIVPVGVAYGTDPRKVEKILLEIAQAHPMVLANPAPYVVFQSFGASSLDFEIRAILRDVNWVLTARSDMNYEIARRFEEEGIEVPFAQRDIWIRNPEALVPGGASAKPPSDVAGEPGTSAKHSGRAHLEGEDVAPEGKDGTETDTSGAGDGEAR